MEGAQRKRPSPLSRAPLQPSPSPASETAGSCHPRPPRTAPRMAQLAPDASQLSPPAARASDANGRLPRARGPQAHRWTIRFMPKRRASRAEKANDARRKKPTAGEEATSRVVVVELGQCGRPDGRRRRCEAPTDLPPEPFSPREAPAHSQRESFSRRRSASWPQTCPWTRSRLRAQVPWPSRWATNAVRSFDRP